MTPLDVITLQQAKDFLKVDFPDDDALITTIIGSAVDYVEQSTQYRLYNRMEVDTSDGTYNVDLFQFPLNSVSIQTFDSADYPKVAIKRDPLRTSILFKGYGMGGSFGGFSGTDGLIYGDGLDNFGGGWFGSSLPLFNIVMNVGYTDTSLIPFTLINAVKNLITYMYENRDLTGAAIPNNIAVQLAQFDRNPMF